MFRLLVLTIAAAAGAAAQPGTTPAPKTGDPGKIAAIEELLSLMKIDRTVQSFVSQFQSAFSQQLQSSIPPGQTPELRSKMSQDVQDFQKQIFAFVTERLRFENLKSSYVKIYDETFSSEEIAGLVGFLKSPIGQAFVEKNPIVMEKSVGVAQQVMRDANPEMQKITNAWVEKMKAKYPDAGRN